MMYFDENDLKRMMMGEHEVGTVVPELKKADYID